MTDLKALVVGLGNPGSQYAQTRHNIGFMLVDALAGQGDWSPVNAKGKYDLYKGTLPGVGRALLLKPLTFMNLSGQAVRHAMAYYAVPPDRLLVVHDEMDLPLGRLRFKADGGVAGHNGLSSIVECLGRKNFERLRLGVGRPQPGRDVKDWVLSRFTPAETPIVDKVVAAAVEGVGIYFREGAAKAMGSLHVFDALA